MVQAEKNDDIKGKLNDYLDPPSRICELKAQLETLQAQLKKQKWVYFGSGLSQSFNPHLWRRYPNIIWKVK